MKDSRMAVSRLALASALSLSLAVSMTPTAVGAQSVDLSKWSPEYIRSIAGTETVDTAADCSKVDAARLQGQGQRLVDRAERRLARHRPQGARGVLGRLEGDLSEHRDRLPEHRLQPAARQAAHRDARQRRADGGAAADPRRRRVRLEGLLPGAEARGRRLSDRGLLARRDQVGDVRRHGLRHPDQQRDHGADLERRHLRARRARPGEPAEDLGRRRRLLEDRSTTSSGSPATASWRSRTPATRRSASCRSSGPMAAARSTRRPTSRPTRRSGSTTRAPRRRCRPPTTCTCATSRCRPRR